MTLLLKIATIDLVKAKQLDFIEHIFIVYMIKHGQDH